MTTGIEYREPLPAGVRADVWISDGKGGTTHVVITADTLQEAAAKLDMMAYEAGDAPVRERKR